MLYKKFLLILKFKVGYMNSIGVVLNNHIEILVIERASISKNQEKDLYMRIKKQRINQWFFNYY